MSVRLRAGGWVEKQLSGAIGAGKTSADALA
jgi:hypothetical protein